MRDPGSIPGLGRSPGEETGYPVSRIQYSGLENSMDSIVHGVAKSRTQLNYFQFIIKAVFLLFFCLFVCLQRASTWKNTIYYS